MSCGENQHNLRPWRQQQGKDVRRARSASSLTGGGAQNQTAWIREEGVLQTGVLEGRGGEEEAI